MSHAEASPELRDPDLLTLAERLRDLGYDTEPSESDGRIRDIVCRRDLGDRAVVVAVDASGRFRAAITWVVGEWPSRDEIEGIPVRVVDAVSRAVTVTGQVASLEQIVPLVAGLDANGPWASVAASNPAPKRDLC